MLNLATLSTFVSLGIPSRNTFASICAKLLPDKSIVSKFGSPPNVSGGNMLMELSAKFNICKESSSPRNESCSMQFIRFPLKSRFRNFRRWRIACDGILTSSLWCSSNSQSERSRPLNASSGISDNGLCDISKRYRPTHHTHTHTTRETHHHHNQTFK